MKRDPLKDFIDENREAFNESFDIDASWAAMQEKTQKRQQFFSSRSLRWLKVAASVIIISGIGFYFLSDSSNNPSIAVNDAPATELPQRISDLSPELSEVEFHYASSIDEMMKEAVELDVSQELLEELAEIDAEQNRLQEEIGMYVNQERVIKAIIKNYRLKLELMEEMLQDLRKTKTKKNVPKNKIIEI